MFGRCSWRITGQSACHEYGKGKDDKGTVFIEHLFLLATGRVCRGRIFAKGFQNLIAPEEQIPPEPKVSRLAVAVGRLDGDVVYDLAAPCCGKLEEI